MRKGIIFATYSSLIGESSSGGKYKTRLNQLLHWLGPHFDGIVSLINYRNNCNEPLQLINDLERLEEKCQYLFPHAIMVIIHYGTFP